MIAAAIDSVLGVVKGAVPQPWLRWWHRIHRSNPADAGAQRWRRIVVSTGSSLVAKVIAMACSLLTIPVALHYLGATRYGVWLTLTSSVSLLSWFDFGIGVGLQNRVSALMGRDQLQEATRCIRSTFLVVLAIALIPLAALGALIFRTDLPMALFASADLDHGELRTVLAIVGIAFVAGLPLSIFSRVAIGLQQGWIWSVAMAIGTVATLAGVWIAARLALAFPAFIAVSVVPPFASQLVCYVLLARRLPGGLPLFGPVALADGVQTLREGLHYVVPQIGGLAIVQGPLFLLGTMATPASAAIYGVIARISLPFLLLQQLFLDQVWPAITEALHRGDREWLHRTLRRLLWSNTAYAAAATLAVILSLWIVFPLLTRTSGLKPSFAVIVLYALNIGTGCITAALAYVSNGLMRMRLQNYFALSCIVAAFTVMPLATRSYGIEGLLVVLNGLNIFLAMPLLYREYALYLAEAPSAQRRDRPETTP